VAILGTSRAELGARVDALVGAPAPAAPFGTYVVGSSDPAAFLGRHLERQVFGDVFDNSEELLAAEYGPYEPTSLFVLVIDHRRKLAAGVIRLVLPSPCGFKTLEDVRRQWGRDPARLVASTGLDGGAPLIWDVATLAVGRDYRRATGSGATILRGLVSLALWQAVGVMAYRCGVDLLVAIIDVRVYRLLQSKLGHAFAPFDGVEPRPYLDSPASVPVWCRPERWRARFVDADPTLYGVMIGGVGLDPAVAPPDWDDVAAMALLVPGARRASGAGRPSGLRPDRAPLRPPRGG
jgi:hypothetical protein